MQKKQGAFTGSAVLKQLSVFLITGTETDGDFQKVKATANDVRTNNFGITQKIKQWKSF